VVIRGEIHRGIGSLRGSFSHELMISRRFFSKFSCCRLMDSLAFCEKLLARVAFCRSCGNCWCRQDECFEEALALERLRALFDDRIRDDRLANWPVCSFRMAKEWLFLLLLLLCTILFQFAFRDAVVARRRVPVFAKAEAAIEIMTPSSLNSGPCLCYVGIDRWNLGKASLDVFTLGKAGKLCDYHC